MNRLFVCPNCKQVSVEVLWFNRINENGVYIEWSWDIGGKIVESVSLVKNPIHLTDYYQCTKCGYIIGGEDELDKCVV